MLCQDDTFATFLQLHVRQRWPVPLGGYVLIPPDDVDPPLAPSSPAAWHRAAADSQQGAGLCQIAEVGPSRWEYQCCWRCGLRCLDPLTVAIHELFSCGPYRMLAELLGRWLSPRTSRRLELPNPPAPAA